MTIISVSLPVLLVSSPLKSLSFSRWTALNLKQRRQRLSSHSFRTCYFFFMLSLSPPTLSTLLSYSDLVAREPLSSSNITWISPGPGDVYRPGDIVIGKWQADQKIVSPSFRLCSGETVGCGDLVWPTVEESAGFYVVSLTVPNVTDAVGLFLQMKDDFGQTTSSPTFNLSPSSQNPASVFTPNDSHPDPASSGSSSESPPAVLSSSRTSTSEPSNASTSIPAPASSPTNPTTMSNPALSTQVASAHTSPPTVALAVPLSLASLVLVAAGVLALHHRRALVAERERDARVLRDPGKGSGMMDKVGLEYGGYRGSSVLGGLSGSVSLLDRVMTDVDIEKALIINSLLSSSSSDRNQRARVDLVGFMKEPYAAPAPVRHDSEPRARTHEPFPLPHTLTVLPQDHHHKTQTPSPTPLQVVSMSLSSARQEWPRTRTDETPSVTSDILPSYLPSPAFDSDPSSSSLDVPPALHVRVPAPTTAPIVPDIIKSSSTVHSEIVPTTTTSTPQSGCDKPLPSCPPHGTVLDDAGRIKAEVEGEGGTRREAVYAAVAKMLHK